MDGRMDGWMDERMNGRMDEQTDGRTERQTYQTLNAEYIYILIG